MESLYAIQLLFVNGSWFSKLKAYVCIQDGNHLADNADKTTVKLQYSGGIKEVLEFKLYFYYKQYKFT